MTAPAHLHFENHGERFHLFPARIRLPIMELSLAKVLEFYQYYLFAAILMSWIQLSEENPIRQFLEMFSEPVLAQARKLIPPLGGIDFSPIPVLIALGMIQGWAMRNGF